MKKLQYPILIFCLIISGYIPNVTAQQMNNDSISIQGKITAKKEIPEGSVFKCKLIQKNALDTWAAYTESFSTPITQKHFRITLPAKDQQWYMTLQIEYPGGKVEVLNMNSGAWESPLLFEKSDSLSLSIGLNGYLEFSGRGAEKLNCQRNLYAMGFIPASAVDREAQLFSQTRFIEASQLLEESYRIALQSKLAVLESYRNSLPPAIFDQLKLDLTGHHKYALYSKLLTAYQLKNPKVIPATKQLLRKLIQMQPKTDTSTAAVNSIHYANSLMLMERVNAQFLHPADSSYQKVNMTAMQASINSHYQGGLKDKILMLAYLELGDRPGVLDHIQEALAGMGNTPSKSMLQQWHKNVESGKPAYPFILPDENGNTKSLPDFKGKVIIADFWFLGCMPCRLMAKALSPIAKHYQNNPSVVFLSINVDNTRQKWEAGLKDGSYSFPGAIHLSTYGSNKDEHPMLKHYAFTGYPQLLVIDQSGNMVSANPPPPALKGGAKFKAMIDSTIKNQSK